VKGIAAQLSIIGIQLIPVVLNPKFAMGGGGRETDFWTNLFEVI